MLFNCDVTNGEAATAYAGDEEELAYFLVALAKAVGTGSTMQSLQGWLVGFCAEDKRALHEFGRAVAEACEPD